MSSNIDHDMPDMSLLTRNLHQDNGDRGANAVGHKSGDSIVVITSRTMTMALMAKIPHHIEAIFAVKSSTVPDTSYETKPFI